jgi:hypothetical protein
MKNEITNLIERLEAFEDRCGVRLESLWAKRRDVNLNGEDVWGARVFGELHSREGTALKRNIELRLDAYDTEGRVVGRGATSFSSKSFFGFETFTVDLYYARDLQLSKIRLYPVISQY